MFIFSALAVERIQREFSPDYYTLLACYREGITISFLTFLGTFSSCAMVTVLRMSAIVQVNGNSSVRNFDGHSDAKSSRQMISVTSLFIFLVSGIPFHL